MIKRDLYMERIRPFMRKDVVKVITGFRRSGKSVMLDLLRDEIGEPQRSIYINFESKMNAKYTNAGQLEVVSHGRRKAKISDLLIVTKRFARGRLYQPMWYGPYVIAEWIKIAAVANDIAGSDCHPGIRHRGDRAEMPGRFPVRAYVFFDFNRV